MSNGKQKSIRRIEQEFVGGKQVAEEVPVVWDQAEETVEEVLTNGERLDEITLILKGIEYERHQRIALVESQVAQLQTQLEAQLSALDTLEQSYKQRRERLAKLIKEG